MEKAFVEISIANPTPFIVIQMKKLICFLILIFAAALVDMWFYNSFSGSSHQRWQTDFIAALEVESLKAARDGDLKAQEAASTSIREGDCRFLAAYGHLYGIFGPFLEKNPESLDAIPKRV